MPRKNVQSPRRDLPLVERDGRPTRVGFDLLQDIVNALNGQKDASGFVFTILLGVKITVGTGSPATVVLGATGDLFLRTDGAAGSVVYYKASGTVAAETTADWTASASG